MGGPGPGRTAGACQRGERRLPVTPRALRVRPVQRQAGEELRYHAAAPAGVVEPAGRAGAPGGRLAQPGEQGRLAPDRLEPARLADVAGQELRVDGERA